MMYKDASYFVQSEALTAYDRAIQRVLRQKIVVDKFVRFVDVGRGKRLGKYWTPVALRDPSMTLDFLNNNEDRLRRTPATKNMVGWHKDIYIPMVERDNTDDIERAEMGNLAEATGLMGEFVQKSVFRGTSIYFSKAAETPEPVTDITGLFNDANAQNLGAGGAGLSADDDLTAIGDIDYTISLMVSKLRANHHYGPYILVVTDGVATQMGRNYNTTTHENELSIIRRNYSEQNFDFSGYIKAIIVTPDLVNAALTTSNQEMMLAEPVASDGQYNFYVQQSYPLERSKPFEDAKEGLFFQIRWMGTPIISRPNAICVTTTLTTSSAS